MGVLGIVGEVAGIGMAVLVPLAFAMYGYRGLSAASRAAGLFKLILAIAVGVALESARRAFGVSYVELASMAWEFGVTVFDTISSIV